MTKRSTESIQMQYDHEWPKKWFINGFCLKELFRQTKPHFSLVLYLSMYFSCLCSQRQLHGYFAITFFAKPPGIHKFQSPGFPQIL